VVTQAKFQLNSDDTQKTANVMS